MIRKEPFDPSPLIDLAQKQRPEDPWLADALTRCTMGYRESRAYMYFIDPTDPGWVVVETVMLTDRKRGDVVLDVLKGHRIGGIEFLKRL